MEAWFFYKDFFNKSEKLFKEQLRDFNYEIILVFDIFLIYLLILHFQPNVTSFLYKKKNKKYIKRISYFLRSIIINNYNVFQVLCMGLGGNVLRFLYISWLKNPWWVLPFEFIQGITHAAVWAACCSYIAHNTPSQLRSSAQGVLQGLHHGLGRGCGAVIGGMFVAAYGKLLTFNISKYDNI